MKRFKVGDVCETNEGIFKIVSFNDKTLIPYEIKWISGLSVVETVDSPGLFYNAKRVSKYNTKLGKILYK